MDLWSNQFLKYAQSTKWSQLIDTRPVAIAPRAKVAMGTLGSRTSYLQFHSSFQSDCCSHSSISKSFMCTQTLWQPEKMLTTSRGQVCDKHCLPSEETLKSANSGRKLIHPCVTTFAPQRAELERLMGEAECRHQISSDTFVFLWHTRKTLIKCYARLDRTIFYLGKYKSEGLKFSKML